MSSARLWFSAHPVSKARSFTLVVFVDERLRLFYYEEGMAVTQWVELFDAYHIFDIFLGEHAACTIARKIERGGGRVELGRIYRLILSKVINP